MLVSNVEKMQYAYGDGNGPGNCAARAIAAAFYDVDGTLIKINIVHAFAFYARRQPSLTESARSAAVKTALSIPVFWAADKLSRKWFNEIFYRLLRGRARTASSCSPRSCSRTSSSRTSIRARSDLIDDSRAAPACRQVLISGALDFTMRPLARYLGVDDLIANQLEFVDSYATGKLKKPFVAGATKADIMRDYAKQHGIDLAESWAYTDSFSDYPMLAVVGHPTACNPDFRLRSLARSYDWPVLDLDEDADALGRAPPAGPGARTPAGRSGTTGGDDKMRAIRPKLARARREHIVTIDTDSAPRIMFYGENLLMRGSARRHARHLSASGR